MKEKIKKIKHGSRDKWRKKTPKGSSVKKFADIVGTLLCVILFPVVLVNITLLVQSLMHPELPPNFLGYTPLAVQSGSMSPFFDTGDLIIIKNAGENQGPYQEGDVVCFQSGTGFVTHRITGVETGEDGSVLYTTQGDANNAPDGVQITQEQILGSYVAHIRRAGGFVMYVQTPRGMVGCVLLPIVIMLLCFQIPVWADRWTDRRRRKSLPGEEKGHERG